MKTFLFFSIICFTLSATAQMQQTFLYELTLYEPYKSRAAWGEREHQIQQEHVEYLDSLTKSGSLQMAGIVDQGMSDHTGMVILNTADYQAAKDIVKQDPSIKNGMMHARLRPLNVYFKQLSPK